jgi:hypothetical protein
MRHHLVTILCAALALAACSAPQQQSADTGDIHVFYEVSGVLQETYIVPPEFTRSGIWVTGVKGDLRVKFDNGTRSRIVLLETTNYRRVRVNETIVVATQYVSAHEVSGDAMVAVIEQANVETGTPRRPMFTLRLKPRAP